MCYFCITKPEGTAIAACVARFRPEGADTWNGWFRGTLSYGVMVTQQILVLFFLVRVRVAQLEGRSSIA